MSATGLETTLLVRWLTSPPGLGDVARRAQRLCGEDGPFAFFRCYAPLGDEGSAFALAQPRTGSSALASALAALELPGPVQASAYRYRIGSRPGIDYLFGPGPVSIFAVDLVDPATAESWNTYYDTQHFATVLTFPGFVAGTRLVLEQTLLAGLDDADRAYLVVYELEDRSVLRSLDAETMPEPNRREYERWQREGAPQTTNPLRLQGMPVVA